jgi:hypothetical protein
MGKEIIFSEGSPVKGKKDIINFMKYMKKKYNIKQEKGVADAVVNAYLQSPTGKDHIVMHNVNDEWFLNFLSNDDVLGQVEIEPETKIYS